MRTETINAQEAIYLKIKKMKSFFSIIIKNQLTNCRHTNWESRFPNFLH